VKEPEPDETSEPEKLPQRFVFGGEIVCLDDAGRPTFNDLLFRRQEPTYIPFDILFVDGEDVPTLPSRNERQSWTTW
jgi:ATP-dependent DNA ligase